MGHCTKYQNLGMILGLYNKNYPDILEYSLTTKKRNFRETIELQVALKNYDPVKDKRFSGVVQLPNCPRPNFTVCVLGDENDLNKCREANIPCMSADDLAKLKKNKKLVKKLADSYGAFLASSSLIRKLPRLLGPGLNKAGKFPSVLSASDDIAAKVTQIQSSIKFQLKSKKVVCLGVPVAHVGMTTDEINANIILAVNFLVSLLNKHWQQVKRLYVKSTMGPVQRIYGF